MEDKDKNAYNASIFNGRLLLSPDAKFIMQATEAAVDLLTICADSMHPKNVLQFLPWRFYLYIAYVQRPSLMPFLSSSLVIDDSCNSSYAAVFLLKAVYLNAIISIDRRVVVRLLKRTIVCLASASEDVGCCVCAAFQHEALP
jgi:hypothetical protein